MKRRFFQVILLCLISSQCIAQLVNYPLTQNGEATVSNEHITASDFTSGNGLSSITFSSNGLYSKSWSTTDLDTSDYYTFYICIEEGFQLQLSKLNFSERRSSTGIRNFKLFYRATSEERLMLDQEVPDDDKERDWEVDLSNFKIEGGDTARIVIYGFNAESSAGSWRINNNSLQLFGELRQVNTNNRTSVVKIPANQIESCIIPSTANTAESAIEVLRFEISDLASGDGLPTLPTQMNFGFESGFHSNPVDLIKSASIQSHQPDSIALSESTIQLFFNEGKILVPDGETQSYGLNIVLNELGITDNNNCRFWIDSLNHNWKCALNGSAFTDTFPKPINAAIHQVQVNANNLKFSTSSLSVTVNDSFSTSGMATDKNGNIDVDFADSVEIIKTSGEGEFYGENLMKTKFNFGHGSWNNLSLNETGEYQLIMKSESIQASDTLIVHSIPGSNAIVACPNTQVAEKTINATFNSVGNAMEVFRFRIIDSCSTDNLPVNIKKIRISNAAPENSADWSSNIDGVLIKDRQQIINIKSIEIKDTYIDITIYKSKLVIANGSSKEISIYIFLDAFKTTDHTNFAFFIDSVSQGFEAYGSGTGFQNTFPANIRSALFPVDINSQKIQFTSPENTGVQREFDIELNATDDFGNTDLDYNSQGIISLHEGDGSITIEDKNITLTNGQATINDIRFSGHGYFSLKFTDDSLGTFVSEPILAADANSMVTSADTIQVNSFISSENSNEKDAFKALSFYIKDSGYTDTLPTLIHKLVFKNALPANSAFWEKTIKSAFIKDDEQILMPDEVKVTNNYLSLKFYSEIVQVENSKDKKFQLYLLLNKFSLVEKECLQFYIEANNHDWETHETGSSLLKSYFNSDVFSSVFTIENSAERILLSTGSCFYKKTDSISTQTLLTDVYGNTDTEATCEIEFLLDNVPVTGSNLSGNAYTSIQLNNNHDTTLLSVQDKNQDLSNAKCLLYLGDTIKEIVHNDFETIDSTDTEDWLISDFQSISGAYSLKHNQFSINNKSAYLFNPETLDLNGNHYQWEFSVKTEDLDLSSTNKFGIWLMADNANLFCDTISGYLLGFNFKNSNDSLAFYHVKNGKYEQLCQFPVKWFKNNCNSFRIIRESSGKWRFFISHPDNLSFLMEIESFQNSEYEQPCYTGLVYRFSQVNAGKLWLDDISINCINSKPVIESVSNPQRGLFRFLFSEQIFTGGNCSFEIIDDNSNSIQIDSFKVKNQYLDLWLNLPEAGIYSFSGNGLTDFEGLEFSFETLYEYVPVPGFNQLIINELMIDPEPTVDLPAIEYLELYNPNNHKVDLTNWTLRINDKELILSNDTIDANSYLILGVNDTLQYYGEFMKVGNMPALTNTEGYVQLTNNFGEITSFINYNTALYQDEDKEDGGWSLERISPHICFDDASNWKASEAPAGGTPGVQNFVFENSYDFEAPEIYSVELTDINCLTIRFSEYIKGFSLDDITIENMHPINIEIQNTLPDSLRLYCNEAFKRGKEYTILIQNMEDLHGNITEELEYSFIIGETATPQDIVINEILFNPLPEGYDFIELYNRSEKFIELKELHFANNDSSKICTLSDSSFIFMPKTYLALSISEDNLFLNYQCDIPENIRQIKELPKMSDDAGEIVLYNPYNEEIDRLVYSEKMHYKLLNETEGVSLERIHPDKATNITSNWHSAAESAGFATPGYVNSQYLQVPETDKTFETWPETISPNNDGYQDELYIQYQFNKEGYVLNAIVYDLAGRKIKQLVSNYLAGTNGELSWDGLGESGNLLSKGIYIIYFEYFDLEGNVFHEKQTCVVAY